MDVSDFLEVLPTYQRGDPARYFQNRRTLKGKSVSSNNANSSFARNLLYTVLSFEFDRIKPFTPKFLGRLR